MRRRRAQNAQVRQRNDVILLVRYSAKTMYRTCVQRHKQAHVEESSEAELLIDLANTCDMMAAS